jgi:prepilin-type N-terminal cleavage/methylation domain-containing protein
MNVKKNHGFTLVETIIALSVTSILIFIILNFTTNSIVQYSVTEARSNLLSQAQSGLDIIGNDIRLSGNADAKNRWEDANAPGAPSDLFSWTSDNDTLVLATAVEDANNNIIFADPALYISEKNNNIYYVVSGKLYKRTIASPVAGNSKATTCPPQQASAMCPADRELLSNVETFSIKYFNDQNQEVTPTDARSIELYVKLSEVKYKQQIGTEYTTRMVFRND